MYSRREILARALGTSAGLALTRSNFQGRLAQTETGNNTPGVRFAGEGRVSAIFRTLDQMPYGLQWISDNKVVVSSTTDRRIQHSILSTNTGELSPITIWDGTKASAVPFKCSFNRSAAAWFQGKSVSQPVLCIADFLTAKPLLSKLNHRTYYTFPLWFDGSGRSVVRLIGAGESLCEVTITPTVRNKKIVDTHVDTTTLPGEAFGGYVPGTPRFSAIGYTSDGVFVGLSQTPGSLLDARVVRVSNSGSHLHYRDFPLELTKTGVFGDVTLSGNRLAWLIKRKSESDSDTLWITELDGYRPRLICSFDRSALKNYDEIKAISGNPVNTDLSVLKGDVIAILSGVG